MVKTCQVSETWQVSIRAVSPIPSVRAAVPEAGEQLRHNCASLRAVVLDALLLASRRLAGKFLTPADDHDEKRRGEEFLPEPSPPGLFLRPKGHISSDLRRELLTRPAAQGRVYWCQPNP